jgi:hypothetical protein
LFLAAGAAPGTDVKLQSAACRTIACRLPAAISRVRQALSFDLLAWLRKGAGVRRNILRRKTG